MSKGWINVWYHFRHLPCFADLLEQATAVGVPAVAGVTAWITCADEYRPERVVPGRRRDGNGKLTCGVDDGASYLIEI